MATALELGPEGWKPYIEAMRSRPEPVPTPEEIAERDRLIEKAREAAAMLKQRYGATRVVLFGSLAHRAWYHPRSDVDLAVDGIAPETFFRAWTAVEHVIRERAVDLVDIAAASPSVYRSVTEDGIDL
jgi:predicted nucleotidyltransferase